MHAAGIDSILHAGGKACTHLRACAPIKWSWPNATHACRFSSNDILTNKNTHVRAQTSTIQKNDRDPSTSLNDPETQQHKMRTQIDTDLNDQSSNRENCTSLHNFFDMAHCTLKCSPQREVQESPDRPSTISKHSTITNTQNLMTKSNNQVPSTSPHNFRTQHHHTHARARVHTHAHSPSPLKAAIESPARPPIIPEHSNVTLQHPTSTAKRSRYLGGSCPSATHVEDCLNNS